MKIQCECGQFTADLKKFPEESPGRLGCYCDDCQSFLIYLNRTDVLDSAGCTEIVPIYPHNLTFKTGASNLRCLKLSSKGTFRWATSCCNSPIANTKIGMPWIGLFAHVFSYNDQQFIEKTFGPIKSRIMGKFAKGKTAVGTADKMNFRAIVTVLPFMVKGLIFRKHIPSPFFENDHTTPITKPLVLSLSERQNLKEKFETTLSYK